ncbi:lipopolysaccharide assembly protein LapA domain-containing protein [Lacibacterium aquatile]|uniref:Lipopolysaccharide assembly protein LapA domain-containing protein n=1 Tax=Lacibacterium aquatile TaxID=1168082 RepID=A0ABW5DLJ9_9PROT
MRRLSLLITLPLTLVCIIFAVANRQPVTIDLWPFALAVETPAFVLVLGTLFLGLLCGAGLSWIPLLNWRTRAKAREKKISKLEQELAVAKPTVPATKP